MVSLSRGICVVLTIILSHVITSAATPISENGRALVPVITSAQSTPRVKAAAATLAEYLGKMSGARFEVKPGDGKTGIAVGTAADFPALALADQFQPGDPTRREEYLLRSHLGGAYLIGATEQAVEHAVWDLLYRLGYRQFFPGANWEVVPSTPSLSIDVNSRELPAYNSRRIWFTYGTWKENLATHREWEKRNRMGEGLRLESGHAYDQIIRANQDEFKAHPEYLSGPNKLCVSNPGLRKLVVDYALEYFEKNPTADSISMDPSDGGGWNDNGACRDGATYKNISDRVVTLANEVAEAVNQKYGDKYVGFYAYNYHSPPPPIRVHPKAVVNVATAFIKGGYSADQLVEGWQKQGATIGVREYYSIIHWDHDLPGKPRAANFKSLANSIAAFHSRGARFISAESSDNWGPAGLGYYLASRVMWDTGEKDNLEPLLDDFLGKSFGPARAPMEEYYGMLYSGLGTTRRMPLGEDTIGRMYRHLEAARQLTDDAQILARIGDLVHYTRFVELSNRYRTTRGAERQAAFEEMIQYGYRIRESHMVHSLAHYRVAVRDRSVKIPAEAGFKIAEDKNPWKSSAPFTSAEIKQNIAQGIERNKLLAFEPIDFSRDLVPATPLRLPEVEPGRFNMTRGGQTYFTWIPEGRKTLSLQLSSGHTYGNRGEAGVRLFSIVSNVSAVETAEQEPAGEAGAEEDGEALPEVEKPELLDEASAPPDKTARELTLKSDRTGLHRLELQDNKMGSHLRWPEGTPMVIVSSANARTAIWGTWSAYFYVPKGTKTVSGFADGRGMIRNSEKQKVYDFNGSLDYFNIPVKPGQDGKLWQFIGKGQLGLMTVPPYLALRADELLLPREVVDADSPK